MKKHQWITLRREDAGAPRPAVKARRRAGGLSAGEVKALAGQGRIAKGDGRYTSALAKAKRQRQRQLETHLAKQRAESAAVVEELRGLREDLAEREHVRRHGRERATLISVDGDAAGGTSRLELEPASSLAKAVVLDQDAATVDWPSNLRRPTRKARTKPTAKDGGRESYASVIFGQE